MMSYGAQKPTISPDEATCNLDKVDIVSRFTFLVSKKKKNNKTLNYRKQRMQPWCTSHNIGMSEIFWVKFGADNDVYKCLPNT